jgi:preprotein translocase subunit SecG
LKPFTTMRTLLLLFHVGIAIGLIALVLLQHGKGAEAGAAFGSGASSTVFGSRGSASFLSRITAVLAAGFFLTSLSLTYFVAQTSAPVSVVDQVQKAPVEEVDKGAVPSNAPKDVPKIPQPPTQ